MEQASYVNFGIEKCDIWAVGSNLGVAHQKAMCDHTEIRWTNFAGRYRRKGQALFDFTAWFLFQKQESVHWTLLFFFHFSKILGRVRFHTRSKQSHECDSVEILTIIVLR